MVQNPHSVQADTHDYFLRRPKAGRLHLASKSGPEPHSRGLVGGPGVPKVAPDPSPYMVLRAVWLVALRLDGVVFQKVAPELLRCIGDAGRLVFSLSSRGSMGWCSKKLSQILHSVYYWYIALSSSPLPCLLKGRSLYPKLPQARAS